MANHPGGPPSPAPQPVTSARGNEPRPSSTSGRRAVVGPASALRGQLSAGEDLWIEGQLEGEIQAPDHQVTVSPGGRVRGEVKARTVVVEGELYGNVLASEMVMVRAGGRMQGDIRAPRVGLEEGCQFQGHVDMDGTLAVLPALAPIAAVPAIAPTEPVPVAPVPASPADATVPAETPAMVGKGEG
jgi:cytoskeletal protein CcmA (bactofilin family)